MKDEHGLAKKGKKAGKQFASKNCKDNKKKNDRFTLHCQF